MSDPTNNANGIPDAIETPATPATEPETPATPAAEPETAPEVPAEPESEE